MKKLLVKSVLPCALLISTISCMQNSSEKINDLKKANNTTPQTKTDLQSFIEKNNMDPGAVCTFTLPQQQSTQSQATQSATLAQSSTVQRLKKAASIAVFYGIPLACVVAVNPFARTWYCNDTSQARNNDCDAVMDTVTTLGMLIPALKLLYDHWQNHESSVKSNETIVKCNDGRQVMFIHQP